MNRIYGSVLGLLTATFAASGVASAQEATLTLERSHLRGRAQIAAAPSYTFDLEDGDFNPFGVGLGAQGGYTLSSGIYLGARFVYDLGDSLSVASSAGPTALEAKSNMMLIGGDLGYDIGAGPLVIRPTVQVGLAHLMQESTVAGHSETESDDRLFLAPGASLILPFADGRVFAGVDGRYYAVLGDDAISGFGLGGFVGAAF